MGIKYLSSTGVSWLIEKVKAIQTSLTALTSRVSTNETNITNDTKTYKSVGATFKPYASSTYSTDNAVQVTLWRTGNTVYCRISSVASLPSYSASTGFSEYTIPSGYRPVADTALTYPCISGSNVLGYGSWGITTAGKMYIRGNQCAKQWTERHAAGSWITADSYPS